MHDFFKTKNISDQNYINFTYPGIVLVGYDKSTVSFKNIEISQILFTQIVILDILNKEFLQNKYIFQIKLHFLPQNELHGAEEIRTVETAELPVLVIHASGSSPRRGGCRRPPAWSS